MPHFDVYYYPAEHNPASQVGRLAERWYRRYSTLFMWQLTSRQPVIVYANGPDFRTTTVIPGFISEATGGVMSPCGDESSFRFPVLWRLLFESAAVTSQCHFSSFNRTECSLQCVRS